MTLPIVNLLAWTGGAAVLGGMAAFFAGAALVDPVRVAEYRPSDPAALLTSLDIRDWERHLANGFNLEALIPAERLGVPRTLGESFRPFEAAVVTKNRDVVRVMIGAGVDVSRPPHNRAACLASQVGDTSMVRLLVTHGALVPSADACAPRKGVVNPESGFATAGRD